MKVYNLRKNGYRVRINHRRRYFDRANKRYVFLTDYEKSLSPMSGVPPEPKGGITIINLTTPEGDELHGEAECSVKDCYDRKLGVSLALARAMELLPV